jgi:hypothetical protein
VIILKRNALEKYLYKHGCFTARFSYFYTASNIVKGFQHTILMQDLKDEFGLIADGHIWIKDRYNLIRFFQVNRLIEFEAKAKPYTKYNSAESFELIDVRNVKILNSWKVV